MKERPILFSAPMVRAVLDGTKTQTRRAIKPQRELAAHHMLVLDHQKGEVYLHGSTLSRSIRCPYGNVGDCLWVRENGWERPERTPKMFREGAETWAPYYYDADGEDGDELKRLGFRRRPSIFMPRWASRIALEVTAVRVERLQDISAADALAEGCGMHPNGYYMGGPHKHVGRNQFVTPTGAYRDLWGSINGPKSWPSNPWVWAIHFNRIAP